MVTIIVFLLGASLGSFFAVVVERIINRKSFVANRSICVSCKHKLGPLDLIPVFSYILLNSRCRYCHKKIPFILFIQECVAGFIAVFLFMYGLYEISFTNLTIFELFLGISLLSVLFSILFLIFFSDFRYMLIPDIYIYILVLLYILIFIIFNLTDLSALTLVSTFTGSLKSHVMAAMVMWLFFYISYVITKKRALGEGDIFLAPVLALYLGLSNSIVMWFVSFLTGSVVGVILILIKGKKMGYKIAFGPFLISGFVIALLFGEYILDWYIKFL